MKTNHFFILKKEKNTLITKSPTNPKINSLRNSSKKTKQPKRLHPLTNIISEKKNQKLLNGFNNSFAKEESSFSSDAKFNSGRWNKDEHNKFLKGLIQYGNDWKMVQKIIKTRSSSQSRSHAQKFFLKLKNLIKTAKISTEENDLYEYIFKKNKNALDLNDIKLTEQEKKQLLKIIISSINLFDKNKMIRKNTILSGEYIINNYDNYKNNLIIPSEHNSFHSDKDEDDEDFNPIEDKNNDEIKQNKNKNIVFVSNKRRRSYDELEYKDNNINKIKKIFHVKKCTKYKYSEEFYISQNNNEKKINNNNGNLNNNSKDKPITNNNGNENVLNNINSNNVNYPLINGNCIINNNIINIMNNCNNINNQNNIDLSSLNIFNNNMQNLNTININNINFINNESNKGFHFMDNTFDNNNFYESQKKLAYDYIGFNDQNYNEMNFYLKQNENNDEISIMDQKKINMYYISNI